VIGIDTNVLVRYFAQDDPKQSLSATRFIERKLSTRDQGHVSLVALAELVWVLRTRLAAATDEVSAVVSVLLSDARFVVQDAAAAWAALDLYQQAGVDLADALIAAVDRLHGCTHSVTFDAKAARIPGMTLLR
jgi:predicted nucleic-acid-binding protein